MTPTQIANVRRLMKESRARRRAAAYKAADQRDAEIMRQRVEHADIARPASYQVACHE